MTMTGVFTIYGRRVISKLLRGDDDALPLLYMGWGDSTTDLSAYDLTLGNEQARAAATVSRVDADTYRAVHTFDIAIGTSYSEVGIFDSALGGNMISRHGVYPLSPEGLATVSSRTSSDGQVRFTVNLNIAQGSY